VYSKRWYLIHLLGGKCVGCNDENFYKLEIDHKYGDGNGERKYHTYADKRYLSNPSRAKQRLQILCKKCHEEKHHLIIPIIEEFKNTGELIPSTFQKLDTESRVNLFFMVLSICEMKKFKIFLDMIKNIHNRSIKNY